MLKKFLHGIKKSHPELVSGTHRTGLLEVYDLLAECKAGDLNDGVLKQVQHDIKKNRHPKLVSGTHRTGVLEVSDLLAECKAGDL